MEKDNTQTPNTETDTRETPPYYKIDHRMAVAIWQYCLKRSMSHLRVVYVEP